jgi:type I restriction enzyme S subunit
MKWKAYPRYKPSGVEWLGQIPEHWDIRKLKHISSIQFSNVDKHTVEGEKPVRLCNYVDVYRHDFITADLNFMEATAPPAQIAKFALSAGDVIITKDSEAWDDIAVPAYVSSEMHDVLCGYHLAQIRPDPNWADGKYLFRAFCSRGINDQFRVAATGITRYGLGKYWLDNGLFLVPPVEEQRAIAAYLDRETERLDALMEKKQRQIELLQKKRAALISHAVTRGLDPTVKMKDSGVEWLWEVPKHWQVKRMKHVSKVKYGLGEPPDQLEDGLPFIRATDIHRGKINSEAILKVDPKDIPWSRDPELRTNDILVVRSGAYTGDSAIVPEEWAGAIAGYDMVLRVSGAMPHFVAYALLSKYLLYGQIYLERSRAAQPHLNAEELGSFMILLPPKPEQEEIVSYLDSETEKSDALMEMVKDSIKLLREYRTALISAAVTGKIDVREETA